MAKFDIVIFGATSFVGQILCRYMIEQYHDHKEVKWAIAGRNRAKLDELVHSLGALAERLPVLVADAADETSLRTLCDSTKVVVSTVGPYALYGEALVSTCASQGTDYCDLTGEVQWIAKMIRRYESVAKISGARIVHSCGFDSIPSDLGVYYLQQQAEAKFSQSCSKVKMRVKKMRGAASGGTVASIMNVVKEASKDSELRKLLTNPYAICPKDHGFSARQDNLTYPRYEQEFHSWIAPFVMATINTRIVHRSNALLHKQYGEQFYYDEAMLTGDHIGGSLGAGALVGGLAAFMLAAAIPPTRWAMENFILPKPGQGPSLEEQLNGCFDLRFKGTTVDGQSIDCKVYGDQDPGYGSTAKMLGQAAVCLAKDISKKDKAGGFWTPSSIFGEALIDRLQLHSGLTFEVLE
jgi:short subunit dehydrogenase-like uncharacterized protein